MEPELHPDLEPLKFLLGDWEGAGVGGYPNIESFRFGQEISFRHIGKPYLIYTSRTWRLDDEGKLGAPLAQESGYWRAHSGGRIELVLAHPTGIAEIYIGNVISTRVELRTDVVARTETAKEYTAGHRLYGLIGEDLGYAYDMAAEGQSLQSHLSAQLKRVA
ncbi:FABP family protein [Actinoallomurus sp. CA-142502]|uniref:FABP family protein n=1 Tax=Actinoallomurus sp. CA-142502 TaxID=3239885 RepID=UPI003D8EFF0D